MNVACEIQNFCGNFISLSKIISLNYSWGCVFLLSAPKGGDNSACVAGVSRRGRGRGKTFLSILRLPRRLAIIHRRQLFEAKFQCFRGNSFFEGQLLFKEIRQL